MNLNNWQQTSELTLIVTDGEVEQEYRLTFGKCSSVDVGLFNRRRSKIFTHMRETYGDEWLDNDEACVLQDLMTRHCLVLAALRSTEMKEGEDWVKTELPESWLDTYRFPLEAPPELLAPLTEAVLAAGNPARLFGFIPTGDEEKKVLRLTVRPSES